MTSGDPQGVTTKMTALGQGRVKTRALADGAECFSQPSF
jgi:hypothetical protein